MIKVIKRIIFSKLITILLLLTNFLCRLILSKKTNANTKTKINADLSVPCSAIRLKTVLTKINENRDKNSKKLFLSILFLIYLRNIIL